MIYLHNSEKAQGVLVHVVRVFQEVAMLQQLAKLSSLAGVAIYHGLRRRVCHLLQRKYLGLSKRVPQEYPSFEVFLVAVYYKTMYGTPSICPTIGQRPHCLYHPNVHTQITL